MIRSSMTTSGFCKKYSSSAVRPSAASMTSWPSETRMSLRILRDIVESSTTSTLAIHHLHQYLRHLLQRYDSIGKLGFDNRTRHTVYNTGLFRFSENRASSGLDLRRARLAVISHSGHDNAQYFVPECLGSRSKQHIDGRAMQ